MRDFREHLNRKLQDPEFAKEYEACRPEQEAIHTVAAARIKNNMTQKELAEKAGIRQPNTRKDAWRMTRHYVNKNVLLWLSDRTPPE